MIKVKHNRDKYIGETINGRIAFFTAVLESSTDNRDELSECILDIKYERVLIDDYSCEYGDKPSFIVHYDTAFSRNIKKSVWLKALKERISAWNNGEKHRKYERT